MEDREELSGRTPVQSAAPTDRLAGPAGTGPGPGRGRPGDRCGCSRPAAASRAACRGRRARGGSGGPPWWGGGRMGGTCRVLCSEEVWCFVLDHRGRPEPWNRRNSGRPRSPDTGSSCLGDRLKDTCGFDIPEFDHSSGHMGGSYRGNTSSYTGVSGSFWFLDIWSHTGIPYDRASASCVCHTCTPSPPPVCRSHSFLCDTSLNRCVLNRTDGGRRCLHTASLPLYTAETTWSCRRDTFC